MDASAVPQANATPALRADAAENRRRLIEAAGAVFAERGLYAPLDEIARRAGVGNATLYRRFPTRADLVAAVYEERLADYVSAAEEALRIPDAWAGFAQYVERICEMQAGSRGGVAEVLTVTFSAAPPLQAMRDRASEAVATLIEQAQAAGQLRDDFGLGDLTLLMIANAGIVGGTGELAPRTSQRFISLALDGLRTEAAHPAAPALAFPELYDSMRRVVVSSGAGVVDLPATSEGA